MIDYDPHDWRAHIFVIKGSMVRQIIARVLSCTLFAVIVTELHVDAQRWFENKIDLSIPDRAHSLIGGFLALLLVFRTNASYDRFWEGRKQWGSIVNESRNLARAAAAFLPTHPDLAHRVIRWTAAFAYATMDSLRGARGIGPLATHLPPDEVAQILAADHVPLAVARKISEAFAEARRRGAITDYVQVTLDQNVQLLIDYMGACERIHKTPLPFAYVVHLRRAIVVFCFTLPFTFVTTFGRITPIATFLIAYVLLGIEEIGVQIEDPFGFDDNDLPLERICATIERNVLAVGNTLRDARPVSIGQPTGEIPIVTEEGLPPG